MRRNDRTLLFSSPTSSVHGPGYNKYSQPVENSHQPLTFDPLRQRPIEKVLIHPLSSTNSSVQKGQTNIATSSNATPSETPELSNKSLTRKPKKIKSVALLQPYASPAPSSYSSTGSFIPSGTRQPANMGRMDQRIKSVSLLQTYKPDDSQSDSQSQKSSDKGRLKSSLHHSQPDLGRTAELGIPEYPLTPSEPGSPVEASRSLLAGSVDSFALAHQRQQVQPTSRQQRASKAVWYEQYPPSSSQHIEQPHSMSEEREDPSRRSMSGTFYSMDGSMSIMTQGRQQSNQGGVIHHHGSDTSSPTSSSAGILPPGRDENGVPWWLKGKEGISKFGRSQMSVASSEDAEQDIDPRLRRYQDVLQSKQVPAGSASGINDGLELSQQSQKKASQSSHHSQHSSQRSMKERMQHQLPGSDPHPLDDVLLHDELGEGAIDPYGFDQFDDHAAGHNSSQPQQTPFAAPTYDEGDSDYDEGETEPMFTTPQPRGPLYAPGAQNSAGYRPINQQVYEFDGSQSKGVRRVPHPQGELEAEGPSSRVFRSYVITESKDLLALGIYMLVMLVITVGVYSMLGSAPYPGMVVPPGMPQLSNGIAQVTRGFTTVLWVMFATLVLGYLWVVCMKLFARVVVRVSMVGIPIISLGMAIWGVQAYMSVFTGSTPSSSLSTFLLVFLIASALMAILFTLFLSYRQQHLDLTLSLMTMASDILSSHTGLMFACLLLLATNLAVATVWLFIVLRFGIVLTAAMLGLDTGGWGGFKGVMWMILVGLGGIWTCESLLNLQRTTVAGVVADWYYFRHSTRSRVGPQLAPTALESLRRSICVCLGSISLASLWLSLVKALELGMILMPWKTRRTMGVRVDLRTSPYSFVWRHLMSRFPLYAFRSIARTLFTTNRFGLMYLQLPSAGIYPPPFSQSARETSHVFKRALVEDLVQRVSDGQVVIWMGPMIMAMLATASGMWAMGRTRSANEIGEVDAAGIWEVAVVGGMTTYYLARHFGVMIADTVDTLVLCYAMDVSTSTCHSHAVHNILRPYHTTLHRTTLPQTRLDRITSHQTR